MLTGFLLLQYPPELQSDGHEIFGGGAWCVNPPSQGKVSIIDDFDGAKFDAMLNEQQDTARSRVAEL